jgi:hypothetical protein
MSEDLGMALAAHLRRWAARDFDLGTVDCVAFTTEWIDAQRGTHYTELVQRRFRSLTFTELRVYAEPGRLLREICGVLGAPLGALTPKLGDAVVFANGLRRDTFGVAGAELVYSPDARGVGGFAAAGRVVAVWALEGIE